MHSALSKRGLDVTETGFFSWSLDDWRPKAFRLRTRLFPG
jgi:hypothetical protein